MLRNLYKIIILALLVSPAVAHSAKGKSKASGYEPTLPAKTEVTPADGSIFQVGRFSALTSGQRASRIGDIVTIVLVERTSAAKSNSAATGRSGSVGLSPPVTGPLSVFSAGDVNISGDQSFKGSGTAVQSNSISGELSVIVAAVYANGNMLVQGDKLLTLNRGDENVQFSGIVRSADINADNKILSTRVAAARIRYTGKGEIARASQQGWLQRFFSMLSPF